jgi:hypothetical protein
MSDTILHNQPHEGRGTWAVGALEERIVTNAGIGRNTADEREEKVLPGGAAETCENDAAQLKPPMTPRGADDLRSPEIANSRAQPDDYENFGYREALTSPW